MAAALAGCLAWPIVAVAQSTPPLAEVARKEAERRKGLKESGKTITAKDLPESARKPAGSAPTSASGAGAGQTSATPAAQSTAGDAAKDGPKDEAFWRQRITQAQEGLRRSQAFAEALQSRINALTTDFVNRDDPYQRAKIGEDRQTALAELERVKVEIESFKKQLVDIEEDARKAGVPPGWLR